MKKLISLVLAIAIAVSLFCGILPAQEVLALEDGVFLYTLDAGDATVTGYTGPGGSVVVPEKLDGYPVVSIGTSAFRNNTTLTSITFPASLTTIANGSNNSGGAFYGCSYLASVTFNDSAADIGNHRFSHHSMT